MAKGPREHIVPRMMIRRFAGENGSLYGMRKSSLTIIEKPVRPESILLKKRYYQSSLSDWDKYFLTPIEQRFAHFYPTLADEPWTEQDAPTEEGEAFIDWAMALLCRTQVLPETTEPLLERAPPEIRREIARNPKETLRLLREQSFKCWKEVYTLPTVKWMCFVVSSHASLVLTDHPVCQASGKNHVLLVPLSRKRLIFGGTRKSLDEVKATRRMRDLNVFLAACAFEWIYAADQRTLEDLRSVLSGDTGEYDPEWLAAARMPALGLSSRIRANPIPEGIDTEDVFERIKKQLLGSEPRASEDIQ